MKERPILFSGPMVRAILDGRKTQTRRIINPQPNVEGFSSAECPYGKPGDRLWVRETWWKIPEPSLRQLRDGADTWPKVAYNADESDICREQNREMGWVLRPSIFMPRWASRITLEVKDVRVQRLRDITEEDAKAEGAPCIDHATGREDVLQVSGSFRLGFQYLWDSINAERAPWASNPWVWAVTFHPVPSPSDSKEQK